MRASQGSRERRLARRAPAVAVGLVLALFAYTFLWNEVVLLHGYLIDDAYISLRHAKNLVDGNGLVYNPGERVEGYTNFLLTIAMAIPYALRIDAVAFAKAVGFVSGAAVIVGTGALTRRVAGAAAALVVMVVMALDQRVGWFTAVGLETMLVGALSVPAFLLLDRRRVVASALLFAACAMTRMETVLLFGVALAFLVARSGFRLRDARATRDRLARPLRFLVVFSAVFGAYYGWRFAYYGWPFPNTYYAKVGSLGSAWQRGIEYLDVSFATMGIRHAVVTTAAALAVVGVFAIVRRRPRRRGLAPVVVTALVVYATYVVSVGGDHFRERFVYHFLPLLLATIAWTWRRLADLLRGSIPGVRRRLSAPRAHALVAVPLAALATVPAAGVLLGGTTGVAAWQATGAYARTHTSDGDAVATCAAGVIGLESERRTIDLLGLTDAHIAHLPIATGSGIAGHEKTDPAYVLDQKPAIVTTWIDADGHIGRGLRKHWRFWRDYELAAIARTDGIYDASPARLHTIDAFVAPATLAEWRRGRGGVVGHFDWGVWRRRTRPIPPRPFGRLDLGTGVPGTLDHPEALVVAPRGHAPGHVFFGPGMIFPPGRYRASFDVKLSGGPVARDEKLCNFDVWDGVAVTNEEPLAADEWLDRSHVLSAFLTITDETQGRPVELRLHCRGLVDVVVARGAIEPCEGECGEGVVLDRPM